MTESSSNAALARRIEQQLAAAGLQVDADFSDGTLTLSGIVETEESHQAALDIATAVVPSERIDDEIEVESVLPTEIDDFASDQPTAELFDTPEEVVAAGGELEPDFTDRPGLSDPFAASGPSNSEDEDLAETGEVYTPPIDPVVTTSPHGDVQILGGFEMDAEEDTDVEPSASDRHPGDEALADAVRRELAEDAATTDLNIVVAVRNGVVHLRGQVADLDDADNAESVAARVPGVRDVVEELDVANV
jgi:osmotically-inducible protein OsmY